MVGTFGVCSTDSLCSFRKCAAVREIYVRSVRELLRTIFTRGPSKVLRKGGAFFFYQHTYGNMKWN